MQSLYNGYLAALCVRNDTYMTRKNIGTNCLGSYNLGSSEEPSRYIMSMDFEEISYQMFQAIYAYLGFL